MDEKDKLKTEYNDGTIELKVSKNPPSWYIWARSAANIIPVTKDGKFLIMHEYKSTIKKWIWGFPGGMIEKSETASGTAKRECEEELGIKVGKVKKIIEIKTDFPDTSVTYFLGFDLSKCQGKGWEKIGKIKEVTIKELEKMALEGKIQDPRMVVAILRLVRDIKKLM